ncbi:MAG TPA: chemotaxis protein CheW [Ktedonobacterales bacterium]
MGTVFDEEFNQPAQAPGTLPPPLAQLLTATRANTAEVMERLLLQAQTGELPFEELGGTEYLLFTCGGVDCGVPLAALREVVPALPQVAPLPASPEWMMGIFALRTEMIALIDPVPMLLDSAEAHADPHHFTLSQPTSESIPRSALIVGTGERCLAWAIALVGDIVRLDDDMIAPHTRETTAGAGEVRERYVAGDYVIPRSGRRYTLLQTDLVLDDVLHALEEEPDGRA